MSVGRWEDVSCDALAVGDILRVKIDAYATKSCAFHNGRLVKVLGINGGDVCVTTVDYKMPFIGMARHSPYKLEKAVA